MYATDGIKGTSNSSGITFRADSTIWRLGGNNVLLHNDTAHRIGLEKNDSLIFRVDGEYAGIISHTGNILSMGYDGMRLYFSPGYTGSANTNFGAGGQYSNKVGSENSSFGTNAMVDNLSGGNTGIGNNAMRGNKYGANTSVLGNNAGYPNYTGWETLDGCVFLGADTGPDSSIPTYDAVYNAIAIGNGTRAKSYQTVIGNDLTQEAIIRGRVYANITPRDSLIFTTTDTARLNLDTDNALAIGSLANNLHIANPVGTLNNFKEIIYRIQSNGIAHTLTFGTMFHFSTDLPAPTTTVASKRLYIRGYYNSSDNTIDVVQVLNNF